MAVRTGALQGLRVIELADEIGQLCGRLLADLGAEVIKLESPTGGTGRSRPPFAGVSAHIEGSLSFAWFNANKRSLVVDATTEAGRDVFAKLLETADVLLYETPESLAILGARATERTLSESFPHLIVCSISGFGTSGPHSHYLAPDLVTFAMSGQMYVSGEPTSEPLVAPYMQADQMASVTAAFGVVLAIFERYKSGLGQVLEVSAQEVLAAGQHLIVNYGANSQVLPRGGSRSAVGGAAAPQGVYACKDGYVYLFTLWVDHWRSLLEWMGSPEALRSELFENRHFRTENVELIDMFVVDFLATKTRAELFQEGQARRVFIGAINEPGDFLVNEQVQFRDFFAKRVTHEHMGTIPMPGFPYQLSETPLEYRRAAPILNEAAADKQILERSDQAWSIRSNSTPEGATESRPLVGIRILDFTHAVAGPTMTRMMAEFGAEVIKVETVNRSQRGRATREAPVPFRQQAATFTDLNRDKRSLVLDMSSEAGRSVAKDLIRECDVVVNNFSPRVMRKWVLDYESLRQLRPDIVCVDMPGYGLDGPQQDYIAGAVVVAALTGTYHLWDYQGDLAPAGPAAWYPDYGAGAMAAMAAVAALLHRSKTGQGQHIEQSQLEAVASFIAPAYLDVLVNGHSPEPLGNGSTQAAPYGTYPCAGRDRWCVIAVDSECQWQAFKTALGSPDWSEDERFRTVEGRVQASEELDKRVAEWTASRSPYQVMRILQAHGVPAGAVQDAEDLYRDPHLWSRSFTKPMGHEIGVTTYTPCELVRMSRTPAKTGMVSELGQDNGRILKQLIGYSDDQIRSLAAGGAFEGWGSVSDE